MARVKRGVTAHAKHRKVLKAAKGYYDRRKNTIRIAKQAVEKALRAEALEPIVVTYITPTRETRDVIRGVPLRAPELEPMAGPFLRGETLPFFGKAHRFARVIRLTHTATP